MGSTAPTSWLQGKKTHILVGLYVLFTAIGAYQSGQLLELETLKEQLLALMVSTVREGLKAV
jgi:hypothetical protein